MREREKVARTLSGGPLDGKTFTWHRGMPVEIPHPDRGGLRLHASRYDADGRYQHTTAPGRPKIEPCGRCSLCPGHHVDGGEPDVRYDWENPDGTL